MLTKSALTQEVRKLWAAVNSIREGTTGGSLAPFDQGHSLLTVREATRLYRIGRRRLVSLITNGTLPAIQQPTATGNGYRWRLRRRDCESVLQRQHRVQAG